MGTECSAALTSYTTQMIKNFSPKEIEIMLKLDESNSIVSNRIKRYSNCKSNCKEVVGRDTAAVYNLSK